MLLSAFSYKEANWELTGLSPLNPENLVVGRNSTGKTRTIHAIQNVASFLQMKEILLGSRDFSVEMSFLDQSDAEWSMVYSFKIKSGLIEKENLTVCGRTLIKRTKSKAWYEGKSVNPPAEKLIAQIRRDKYTFPEVERLMVWAEGIVSVSCSDINPFTTIIPAKIFAPIPFYDIVNKLTEADKKNVLKRAKEVGYNLTSIQTIKAGADMRLVQVKERGISEQFVDLQLSSGMLRTVYILAFLEYIKHSDRISILLIDDLGEGLDYGRSIHLGKMVFEDCKKNGLQLIASSNDAFLMDVVDINNWQVLRRKISKVSTINHSNSPELFRKFRMTGLSNFDLFSSDFIDSYIVAQNK